MSGKFTDPRNEDCSTPFIDNGCTSAPQANGGGVGEGSYIANNLHTNANNNSNNPNYPNCLNADSELKTTNREAEYSQMRAKISQLQVILWVMTGIAIAGFIILIIVVSVLYSTLNYNLTHHTHKPKVGEQMAAILEREELCLPCEEFRLGPSVEEAQMLRTFARVEGTEGTKCCVDEPVQLVELLKLYVERRFRTEVARGVINSNRFPPETNLSVKPAAHLMIAHQDLRNVDQIPGRQYTVENWIHNDDLAFTKETVYRHGRIVIPQDGFYFVYSQISFMETFDIHTPQGHGSRHSSDVPSLSHYLFRYNLNYHNGGEEKLAQNSITKCWGQSKTFGEYVSNLGAVFFLRTGDEIFVKVSNLTMVSSDAKLSYFGLFRI